MTNAPRQGANATGSEAALSQAGQDQLLERLRAATLGEYDIYGELGRGGMATVYLAHELALDRKVAIKLMSPAASYGAGMVERFKREARTAANLSHPNIIPVYAVREAGDLLFFVMKLVEGTPLDSIMREVGKLPIPMVEAILAQIGGAFGYAHRRGVVHRDIKPSNILIDEEGWAVVTDFGIAKVAETEGLTQTGVAVGTPTYMSPEQCGGGVVGGASDQYSLGVVAYEMLTGRPPFSGNMMALMYSHFHDTIPPLEQERPDCPEPLRAAITRMLRKDPAARWPAMEDAIAAMGARQLAHDDPTRTELILLARSGVTHKIVSQVQTPRSPVPLTRGMRSAPSAASQAPRRRRSAWLLGAGALFAVAAGATALVLRSRPAPAPPPLPASSVAPIPPAEAGPAQPIPKAVQPERSVPPQVSPKTLTPRQAAPPSEVVAPKSESTTPAPAPAPPPAPVPAPAPAPAPVAAIPVPTPKPVSESASSAPAARVSDEKADVVAAILAYARALEAGDLNQARRLYPEMPAEQRQGLEAFWKAGGSMRTRWTVSEVTVSGEVATARIQGSNTVSSARGRPSEQRVSLRARLERRGTEWRLVGLVN
jgi:serine/threonine-protein kinase